MDRKYNDTTCLLKFLVDPQGYSGEANGLLALYAGDATIGETIGESIVAHVINSSVSYHYYLSHP